MIFTDRFLQEPAKVLKKIVVVVEHFTLGILGITHDVNNIITESNSNPSQCNGCLITLVQITVQLFWETMNTFLTIITII